MDLLFDLNMQKSGLVDTMWDLIVDTAGAVVAATLGALYVRGRGGFLFRRILNKFLAEVKRDVKGA